MPRSRAPLHVAPHLHSLHLSFTFSKIGYLQQAMNKRKAGSDNDSGDAQADLLAEQKKEAKKTAKEKTARQKAKAAKDAKDAKDEKTRPPAVPDPIPAGGDPPSGDPAVNGNIQGRVPPSPKHVPAKP